MYLGGVASNLGLVLGEKGETREALEYLAQSIQTLVSLQGRSAFAREWLRDAHSRRAVILARERRFAEADWDWGQAIELSDRRSRDELCLDRATALARSGAHAPAAAIAKEVEGRSQ